ncbi:MAG TPA: hypothetical protein VK590_07845 [Saprospiraceae bacterium]|nr:hypothetical protein [Saprospiraceae bacterium]
MKANLFLLALSLFALNSCTKDNILTPDLPIKKSKDISTRSIDNIDQNLLKSGAKINLYVNEKNEVTATFDFPTPNTSEIVSWWYEWHYIIKQNEGVKSCNDKTLKFTAYCDSNVSLSVQCTKPNGVKSEIKMTSAKVSMFFKKTKSQIVF